MLKSPELVKKITKNTRMKAGWAARRQLGDLKSGLAPRALGTASRYEICRLLAVHVSECIMGKLHYNNALIFANEEQMYPQRGRY